MRNTRRAVTAQPTWEVALHMPTVRVRVNAPTKEEAEAKAIGLDSQKFADALVHRLQFTRPKAGDVVGAHTVTPEPVLRIAKQIAAMGFRPPYSDDPEHPDNWAAPGDAIDPEQHGGVWGEHPDHPVADWQYEVANGDTRLGYWDWANHRREAQGPDDGAPRSASKDRDYPCRRCGRPAKLTWAGLCPECDAHQNAVRIREHTTAQILKSLGLPDGGPPEDGRHASRYHAAAGMFRVERADDCIWLVDERGPAQNIHMTPDQAAEVGEALLETAAAGDGPAPIQI